MKVIDWEAVRARLAASDLGSSSTPDEAGRRVVLAKRARQLADRRRGEAEATTVAPVLTFTVGDERYGLPLTDLREVFRPLRWTPIPGAGPDLLGVVNIHGEIVPVLDPAVSLGVRRAATGRSGNLLVLRADGTRAALQADRLGEIRRVDLGALNPPAGGADETVAAFIKGMTEDLLAVLDVAALLAGSSLCPAGGLPADTNRGGVAR